MDLSNSVFIACSAFPEKGGWTTDQQFMEQTGSSCLLAHGLGIPVDDARTTFSAPCSAEYNLYVRTKNWTAFWSDSQTTGLFSLYIDGKKAGTFGNGAPQWHWQQGGKVSLTAGEHSLVLHDETGFEGRCDAVLLTMEASLPGEAAEDVVCLRRKLLQIPEPEDAGYFDLVVAGGGVAGMCAAIAAARDGLKVALVHDRKVLGGNNSSEVRVGLGGRLNIGRFPNLGYLLNEFGPRNRGNARTADIYEDDRKMDAVLAERNITLFLGYRVSGAAKSGDLISSITATQVDNYHEIILSGRLFADCTGDAALGVLAGAEWTMGREPRSMYGEPSAPETADGITLGASVQWYCVETDGPASFPDIDWGLPIDDSTVQKVRRGQWYWEVGMADDQMADAERIRDYGMYVVYSNWSYLKNRAAFRDEYACSRLGWMSCIAGKRESRRLIGDFVLKEQDLTDFVLYPDGCVSTSWYIDNHEPDPDNSRRFREPFLSVGRLRPLDYYPIPYRCFYSKNVGNMFMAGRDISVSHIALGTTRVMRTTAMMGEVVGMAAAVCMEKDLLPRGVCESAFDALVRKMERGAGDSRLPYYQTYTLIDTTAVRSEDC